MAGVGRTRKRDQSAATSVIFILLTGAFVLRAFHLTPIIPLVYHVIFHRSPPAYFLLALNATGAFGVLYSLAYVFLLEPLDAVLGVSAAGSLHLDFDHLTPADVIIPVIVFGIYAYLVVSQGLPLSVQVMLGGLITIAASIPLRIIPRLLARWLPTTPFLGIEIVLIGTPLAVGVLIPAMVLVEFLPKGGLGPFL